MGLYQRWRFNRPSFVPLLPPLLLRQRRAKKFLVVDLDGTLLNESSRVSDRVAKALLEASKDDSTLIVIATGKARPAAKAALATNPLLKDSRIVSESSPGIFLNGGASYGENGVPLIDDALPVECVRKAFEQKYDEEFALTAFTSDDRCLALRSSPFLDELHERYHEPKCEILATVDDNHRPKSRPSEENAPHWSRIKMPSTIIHPNFPNYLSTPGDGALVTRAVATMLEVVPKNVDKSRALSALLDSLVLANESSDRNYRLVVVGDGDNDAGMIEFAASMNTDGIEGFGVAMGNASFSSRNAASVVLDENERGRRRRRRHRAVHFVICVLFIIHRKKVLIKAKTNPLGQNKKNILSEDETTTSHFSKHHARRSARKSFASTSSSSRILCFRVHCGPFLGFSRGRV